MNNSYEEMFFEHFNKQLLNVILFHNASCSVKKQTRVSRAIVLELFKYMLNITVFIKRKLLTWNKIN